MFWRGSSDFEMVESVAGWRTPQFFLLNRKMRFWTWKTQQKLRFEMIGSVEGGITVHNRRILVSFLQKERNFDRLQTKTQFRTGKAGKLRFCDDRMNRLLKHSSKTKETCLLVCYFLQKRGNFIFCRERSDFELWQHQKLRFWDDRINQQLKNSSNSKKFEFFLQERRIPNMMTWHDTITAEVSLNSFIARIGDSSNSKNQNGVILFPFFVCSAALDCSKIGKRTLLCCCSRVEEKKNWWCERFL